MLKGNLNLILLGLRGLVDEMGIPICIVHYFLFES